MASASCKVGDNGVWSLLSDLDPHPRSLDLNIRWVLGHLVRVRRLRGRHAPVYLQYLVHPAVLDECKARQELHVRYIGHGGPLAVQSVTTAQMEFWREDGVLNYDHGDWRREVYEQDEAR